MKDDKLDIAFKKNGCTIYLNEDLYYTVIAHKMFDKKKNEFVGNDRELDFLCKTVPGFEECISDYICDFVKVYLKTKKED